MLYCEGSYLQDYHDKDSTFFKSVSEKTGYHQLFIMMVAELDLESTFFVKTSDERFNLCPSAYGF